MHDGVIAAKAESTAALSERSTELKEYLLIIGMVSAHHSPSPLIKVSLVDRLWALPSHMEHIVVEGAFHESGLALGQMVSHFHEIDATMIAEGFVADQTD